MIFIENVFFFMGWSKLLLEEILNEVDTNTARAKFYSNLSNDDFNIVADGKSNLDKVDQFFLNIIRDGIDTGEMVKNTINKLNNTSPNIRDIIRTKIMKNDFIIPTEVKLMIDCLEDTGIVSKNEWAKNGFHVLGKNDEWIATCTTNYAANSHYFSNAQWCTASGRDGYYDGFEMFQRYTIRDSSVLIQFTKIEDKDETYQIECSLYGDYGDCMDRKNKSISPKNLSILVGTDFFEEITNIENVTKYYNITTKQISLEIDYENYIGYIKEARIRYLTKIHEKEYDKALGKVNDFNEKQTDFVLSYLESAKELDLFHNFEFMSELYEFSMSCKKMDNEIAKKFHYLTVDKIHEYKSEEFGNVVLFSMGLIIGPYKYVTRDYNVKNYESDGKGVIIDEFNEDIRRGEHHRGTIACYAIAQVDENGLLTKLISASEPTHGVPALGELHNPVSNQNGTLVFYPNAYRNIPYVYLSSYNGNNGILSLKNFSFTKCNDIPLLGFIHPDNMDYDYVIDIHGRTNHYLQFNHNTGEFIKSDSGLVNNNGVITYKDGDYRGVLIYVKKEKGDTVEENMIMQELPYEIDTLDSFDIRYFSGKGFIIYKVRTREYYVSELDNASETIFKIPTSMVLIYGSEAPEKIWKNTIVAFRDDKALVYYFETKEYYLVSEGKKIPSNAYGETEEDRIKNNNVAKWTANGGYSPNVLQQMNRMWKDNDEFGNTSDTYNRKNMLNNVWDDNDRALDADAEYYALGNRRKGFKEHPNWRGALGFKDYDFDTRNPNSFYRIGKNGKPIDQPWNDEDEIPAFENTNESVKNMHNILDRMNKL